eukprot:TRINITY_DN2106_c0_g1_i4.p1 TRINITY_DN2106_c0_g1~~TRINITY_DN2106_c0_g1_i4.p1  ORF type:complete len:429 (-),score=60.35 TRINITY_DN2106_c0_g1_i4:144-1430(-)
MCGSNATDAMLLLQAAKAHHHFVSNLWENHRDIKYCFSPNIIASSKQAFEDAVQHFVNKVPCVGFRKIAYKSGEQCAETPSIFVQSLNQGCWAQVGQPYRGSAPLNLQANGCDTLGIAAHELGHILGMLHEQSRHDHEKHVKILWNNIQPSKKSQYSLSSDADETVPYDIMSLMHYGDDDFGLPGKKTMEYVDPNSPKVMGNRMGLTQADAQQVAKMYGCLGREKKFKLCTEKPDGCTSEDCVCHQGSGRIKVVDGKCNRCAKQCPNAPYGSPEACGCPAGCSKSSFTNSGTKYSYCNQGCKAPPPAQEENDSGSGSTTTTTTVTQTTTTEAPTTTPSPPPPGACVDATDKCQLYDDYCGWRITVGTSFTLNMQDGGQCPKTCGQCPGQCKDHFPSSCAFYGEDFCGASVTLGGMEYSIACQKLCGSC